jgi:Peptidase A4 family
VLKRFLSASVLLTAILGLTALAPHATVPATAAAPAGVVAAAQVKAPHHHVHEQGFIVEDGRIKMMPSTVVEKDDNNWGGYAVDACSTCGIRYVNANFTAPAVSCAKSTMGTDGAEDDFWVGLDGDTDSTVEQVGIQVVCASKTSAPAYAPWYEMWPLNPVLIPRTVKAGDKISVATYYDQSAKVYDMTFNDSSDTAYTKDGLKCPSGSSCLNKSAEVITENAGDGVPELDLAYFTTVSFSGTTVTSLDGTKGDLCSGSLWSTDTNVMADNNGVIMANPGSFTSCSGPNGFTDYFDSSS